MASFWHELSAKECDGWPGVPLHLGDVGAAHPMVPGATIFERHGAPPVLPVHRKEVCGVSGGLVMPALVSRA